MFFQMFIFLFFYDLLYTAVASALYVMPYEMAVSNKARGDILFWKVIFSVFAMVAPLLLIDVIKPESESDLLFFQTFQIILGIIIGLMLITTFFAVAQHTKNDISQQGFSNLDDDVPVWEVGDYWSYQIHDIDIDFDERTAEISKSWNYKRKTMGSPREITIDRRRFSSIIGPSTKAKIIGAGSHLSFLNT